MMSSLVYKRLITVDEPAEETHYASATSHGDARVKLHSRVYKYDEVPLPDSFLDTLRSSTNQKMWDFMYPEDDEEWTTEVLGNGNLDII